MRSSRLPGKKYICYDFLQLTVSHVTIVRSHFDLRFPLRTNILWPFSTVGTSVNSFERPKVKGKIKGKRPKGLISKQQLDRISE